MQTEYRAKNRAFEDRFTVTVPKQASAKKQLQIINNQLNARMEKRVKDAVDAARPSKKDRALDQAINKSFTSLLGVERSEQYIHLTYGEAQV